MRRDAIGFFWQDLPPEPKEKAAPVKRTPPEPVWLKDDYLPYYEQALAFNVPLLSDSELAYCFANRETMVYDIECYPNYFLVAFKHLKSGKIFYIEMTKGQQLNAEALQLALSRLQLIGFNSNNYDLPMAHAALKGFTTDKLAACSDQIIREDLRSFDFYKLHKIKPLDCNHIDVLEVAPLKASLKLYSGRQHCQKMQDLPFVPGKSLTPEQIAVTRFYCVNDLNNTETLYRTLHPQIDMRHKMGQEYRLELRSKSDAQIAEAVIGQSLRQRLGEKISVPRIAQGTTYRYRAPAWMIFRTPLMQEALRMITTANFPLSEFGKVTIPESINELQINIGAATYRMGIGGLHSSEKCVAHVAAEDELILDRDVTSYYPYIILNQGLYPEHLGRDFLTVYRKIVDRRIDAKRRGDKHTSDSLKITINGSFGKFGNPYSILYSPDLVMQVTLTGQLSLLFLIEALELAGITVISANTDGVTFKCKKSQREIVDNVVKTWETTTGFETEETQYRALYSRDVNNYIAVKMDGSVKEKGAYDNPWKHGISAECLKKNPTTTICIEAAEEYLIKGTPVEQTVRGCTDIRKFISVRTVKGGAVKDGQYLGKAIRWYYSTATQSEIVYAISGNKVPRSEGAMPLMEIASDLPADIDFNWYIAEAESLLVQVGAKQGELNEVGADE